MNDSLLDDVTSLLDGDFGDDRILKQIARACKNNEVISNYERNYVQKLAEQYLGKQPEITPTKQPEIIPPTIPDVVIPEITPSVQSQTFESPSSRSSKSSSKNSKLILGFGGIALIIIIAAVAILSSDTSDSFSSNTVSDIKLELSIQTDLSSYAQTDLISINGISVNYKIVNLSIMNQNNELVWAEQVSVKSDGRYATLAIAGGPGWENSGTYTVNVDDGSEIKSIKFSFTL
jgi:hypothetical protein